MSIINYREDYAKYSRYFVQLKQIYQEKPEVRASLEVLLTLLTISFFVVFAIRPTTNTISTLLSDINSQKEVQAKLEQKIASLSSARQVWTQEQKRLTLLDDALPKEPAPDLYLRQVEGLTAAHNLKLDSYAIEQVTIFGKKPKVVQDLESEKEKDKSGLEKVRIAFVVAGNYVDILGFSNDLDILRKIIDVDSLSIAPKSSGAQRDPSQVTLKVNGYTSYYPK